MNVTESGKIDFTSLWLPPLLAILLSFAISHLVCLRHEVAALSRRLTLSLTPVNSSSRPRRDSGVTELTQQSVIATEGQLGKKDQSMFDCALDNIDRSMFILREVNQNLSEAILKGGEHNEERHFEGMYELRDAHRWRALRLQRRIADQLDQRRKNLAAELDVKIQKRSGEIPVPLDTHSTIDSSTEGRNGIIGWSVGIVSDIARGAIRTTIGAGTLDPVVPTWLPFKLDNILVPSRLEKSSTVKQQLQAHVPATPDQPTKPEILHQGGRKREAVQCELERLERYFEIPNEVWELDEMFRRIRQGIAAARSEGLAGRLRRGTRELGRIAVVGFGGVRSMVHETAEILQQDRILRSVPGGWESTTA
ncbi:hypothetical protein BJ742DRAFT_820412 [Cladochytrium replicatum]|nr:hypothetical protein BJ742DRAFT_820412 [Cladochytrium replicatum]